MEYEIQNVALSFGKQIAKTKKERESQIIKKNNKTVGECKLVWRRTDRTIISTT